MKKRILGLAFALALLACCLLPAFAALQSTNVYDANVYASTNSSGETTIHIGYVGYVNITTGATTTTKVEKRFLGLFWKKVDIGTTDNVWVDGFTGVNGSTTHTVQLPSHGKYRVTTDFDVYGVSGVTDHIERTEQFEWN